jgi:hypothetical protein
MYSNEKFIQMSKIASNSCLEKDHYSKDKKITDTPIILKSISHGHLKKLMVFVGNQNK